MGGRLNRPGRVAPTWRKRMEPKNKRGARLEPLDSELARFWAEPAEDRQLEFDDK